MSAESPFEKGAGQRFTCDTCQVSAETAPGETFVPATVTMLRNTHQGHEFRIEGGQQ